MQSPETNTTLPPTRASFIRSVPLSMPVEEVIERAREAGLELQPSDIHAARYYMRQAATGAPVTKRTIVQPRMRDTASDANGSNGAHGMTAKESKEPQQKVIESFFTVRSVDANGNTAKARDTRDARDHRDSESTTAPDTRNTRNTRNTRGRKALPPPNTSVTAEEELHHLIVRLGSARTREIIDEAEALALSVLIHG